ncbi:MAG: hypothetical protein Q8L82_12815, partial [Nitrosomonas sp.]|nr:hypothetical protein [Nitrosomonas sp.]
MDGGTTAVNTLIVKDGANISGATISNFTNLTFDATGVSDTNDLTMTATQHAGFTGTVTAAGAGANGEKITLTTAASALALKSSIENYVLGNFTNSVTQGATGQVITGDAGDDTVTAITGVTSTSNLAAGTNVVIVSNAANISGGTFSATGGTVGYNLDAATTGTINVAQAALIVSAAGTQNITLSDQASGLTLN